MGSTTLDIQLLVDTQLMGVETHKLGTSSGEVDDTEVGKGVKLDATTGGYVVVVKADEIEGVINSVEPGNRGGGYAWGGVQTKGRANATVGASQTGNIAVGGYVINDTPIADGTAGLIQVFDTGTGYVAPTIFLWRVLRITSGTGAAGDSVIIGRV